MKLQWILAATILVFLTPVILAQETWEYEWEEGEGYHEEEWYDPSDWFDVPGEGISYENGWTDYGYYDDYYYDDYYDYGYDTGYDYYDDTWTNGEYYNGDDWFDTGYDYYTDDWYDYDDSFTDWYDTL